MKFAQIVQLFSFECKLWMFSD